jgi:hypothetical protein
MREIRNVNIVLDRLKLKVAALKTRDWGKSGRDGALFGKCFM